MHGESQIHQWTLLVRHLQFDWSFEEISPILDNVGRLSSWSFSWKLNEALHETKYPLRNMEELIPSAAGQKYNSQLDLSHAYSLMKVRPADTKAWWLIPIQDFLDISDYLLACTLACYLKKFNFSHSSGPWRSVNIVIFADSDNEHDERMPFQYTSTPAHFQA